MTTISVGLDEMESDATGTLDQFSAYQPPRGMDSVREDVSGLGQQVVTDLGALRVSVRRGNTAEVIRRGQELEQLLARLDELESELQS